MSDTDLPDTAPWWAKWLVANAKEALHWASVQIPASIAVLSTVYISDPAGVTAFVKENVPATWWPWLSLGVSILMIVARVTQVPKKPDPPKT